MRFSRLAVLACTLLGINSLLPNLANAQSSKKASSSDDYYNLFEFGVFGGFTHYGKVDAGVGTSLGNGGVAGIRLTENLFDHFGLEESYAAYSDHDLRLGGPVRGTAIRPFETHIYQGAINALAYFTPRERHFRPFLTAGFGVAVFSPTHDARVFAQSLDPALGLGGLSKDSRLQGNYGAGFKWQVHPRVGFRADVRGLVGPNPRFGLPSVSVGGGAFIPSDHWLQGVQTTVGLSFYFGRKELPAPPAPPPPPPPPPPSAHDLTGGSITASATSVCPGERVNLSSNASDPMGHSMSYQWSVDGRAQSGTGSSFVYTADASGDHRIDLRVSDTASGNPANPMPISPAMIHVRQYSRPTVSGVTANPSEMEHGQTAAVTATATGSECSGILTYTWAASEGLITGTDTHAQFNSGPVSFNEGDRSRPQSKQVTLTATVTDTKGGSGSGSTTVTVNTPAQAKHFGDIVFPKDSARVNNCGKRVLIEQLYPMLTANSNYDVVLVGHVDSNESKRRNLDRDRVLNTAAVLSGGSGTCTSLDQSRIKGVWVGTSQESEVLPTSCAVSATAPTERRGNEVDSSEAKNRRVEIWLIPKGMSLPAAAKDAKDLSAADMKRIGCPK